MRRAAGQVTFRSAVDVGAGDTKEVGQFGGAVCSPGGSMWFGSSVDHHHKQRMLQRVVPYERQGRLFGFAQSVE